MLRVINGDVVGAIRAQQLAKVWAYGRYKQKFINLVNNYVNRFDFAGGGIFTPHYCVGIKFQSPVHDGWLVEYKPVADLFFPGYRWGGKYWDDKVEDIYPYLSLYITSAAEKERYLPYIISWTIESPAPYFINPIIASEGAIPSNAYYTVEAVYDYVTETVWDESKGQYVTTTIQVRTKDIYTLYALNLAWLTSLPNQLFYDFITNGNRIRYDVDVAKSSWLESFLPAFTIIVAIVVTIATAQPYAASALTMSESATLSGYMAIESTFGVAAANWAVETIGIAGLEAIGVASTAFSAYNTLGTLNTATSISQGATSFSVTPEIAAQKMGYGVIVFNEYELHPADLTYMKLERSVTLV